MIRGRQMVRSARKRLTQLAKIQRGSRRSSRRLFSVECLEARHLLSASSLFAPESVFDPGVIPGGVPTTVAATTATTNRLLKLEELGIGVSPPPPTGGQSLAGGALLPVAPFPLEDTFFLHSLPGASKTIYLDFDGFITRETQWNADFALPNIITPAYSLDADFINFSDEERLVIQAVWERVAEDFRPFDVNVTTEDPGVEALRNTGGADFEWGQRVVIGGSDNDWFDPEPELSAGGVSYGSFTWASDTPNFVFGADYGPAAADIAEAASHETGHSLGLAHDSQFRFYMDAGEDPPELVRLFVQYYGGHGSGDTTWAPIMGVGYGKNLTQWSKGEYFNATNDEDGTGALQDDLAIITTGNGFGYRFDDHGNMSGTADSLLVGSDVTLLEGEGIIEQNTDIDYFSFTVEGLGELVSLNIQPFHNGPNLDVLAKIYDSNGVVVATGDPIDAIGATFSDVPLLPGNYYVSVEGASRPLTYLDPVFHPGPFEAMGNPPDPPLPPDESDWGYSNYGSLGYYSIVGKRISAVVGVDFDAIGGQSPLNWTTYDGGDLQASLTNLIAETGLATPFKLTIETTGDTPIQTAASANPIDPAELPTHGLPLDELAGYITAQDETLTFTWGNLAPSSVYQVYVFGHADMDVNNVVNVFGGQWNGASQSFSFTQDVTADGLVTNGNEPGSDLLAAYSLLVISDDLGQIKITVTNEAGEEAGIAGLAIAPTKVGTISGQFWNDANGDRVHDVSEVPLPGWIVYLDVNNDGILNGSNSPVVTVDSPDVPQPIQDYAIVKSELFFPEAGEIEDVDVKIDISHTYNSDVNLTLISPLGTRVLLVEDVNPGGENFTNTVFDDEALGAITTGSPPFTGRFKPMAPLSTFDGENALGVWQLEIEDDATGDVGVLNGWSLTVNLKGGFVEPFQTTDANGEYSFVDLPAGQYFVREHFSDQQITDGWRATLEPAPVTVQSGANVVDVEFGNWIPTARHGSISGQKFDDANGSGAKDSGETGLEGWVVYIDSDGDGTRDLGTLPVTVPATGLPKAINDLSTTTSNVTFSGLGTVFNVRVTLDISHSFVEDLEAFLVSPTGRQVELFSGIGSQYNDLHDITFDDNASRSITTIGVNDLPYTGTWKPEGLLSDFAGEVATGIWTLIVRDNDFADQGVLNSWSLEVTSGEVFATTDASGNYTFENLPEGQYIVREEQKPGWTQIPPSVTSITAATFADSQWTVSVEDSDDPNAPVPDSHRNVMNVNFGNKSTAIAGDYNRDSHVDAADYLLFRRTFGTSVPNFSGADGDGDGVIDNDDYGVWRAHFGEGPGSGAGGGAASAAVLAGGAAVSSAIASGSEAFLAAAGSMESTDGSASSSGASIAQFGAGSGQSAAAAGALGIDGVFADSNENSSTESRHSARPSNAVGSAAKFEALLALFAAAGTESGDAALESGVGESDAEDDVESIDAAFESLAACALVGLAVV